MFVGRVGTEPEFAADRESARYARTPLPQLLDDVRSGQTGEYFTIWDAIAKKGTSPQVGWTLYDFLTSDRPYLDRYHCADALLKILTCTEFEAVQLSANWPEVPQNLERLRETSDRLLPFIGTDAP